jgi:hypothetical protein
MEIPIANSNVVDFILVYVSRDSLPPYDFLFLMALVFGMACWFSSVALKQHRKKEFQLKQKVNELNRQRDRDNKIILSLKDKLDGILNDRSSKE